MRGRQEEGLRMGKGNGLPHVHQLAQNGAVLVVKRGKAVESGGKGNGGEE